jgi:hypothetical protein
MYVTKLEIHSLKTGSPYHLPAFSDLNMNHAAPPLQSELIGAIRSPLGASLLPMNGSTGQQPLSRGVTFYFGYENGNNK